jgi:hypothetical protein
MVEQKEVTNERLGEATIMTMGLVSMYWDRKRQNQNFNPNQVVGSWLDTAHRYPEYETKIKDIKQILDKSHRSGSFNTLSNTWSLFRHTTRQDSENKLPQVDRGMGEFIFFSILANRIGLNPPQEYIEPKEAAESLIREASQIRTELDIQIPVDNITVQRVIKSALNGRLRLTPHTESPRA